MFYRLRPGLHFCITEGRAIFFDLGRDRYFALSTKLEAAFARARLATDESPIVDDDVDGLRRAGVLDCSVGETTLVREEPRVAAASDRDAETGMARPRLRDLAEALATQMLATVALRIFSMRRILYRLRPCGINVPNSALPSDVDRLAAAYGMIGILLRTEGQCLPRTLAFVWCCRRRGLPVSLVIGVRVNPFAAHAWAQFRDVVLNDTVERTSLFEPIFAL